MKQILNTLYVQTQGSYLRLDHETLKVEIEKELKLQVPLHHLGGIVAFGNVLLSPFLIHKCAVDGRNLVWLTEYGKFKGRLAGATTGNVLLRQAQHAAVVDKARSLAIGRYFVAGKLQNARNVVMRGFFFFFFLNGKVLTGETDFLIFFDLPYAAHHAATVSMIALKTDIAHPADWSTPMTVSETAATPAENSPALNREMPLSYGEQTDGQTPDRESPKLHQNDISNAPVIPTVPRIAQHQ